jgi:hypothetical protein
MQMKIALCVISTGKYSQFLAPMIRSAREHFFAGDFTPLVFSDQKPSIECEWTEIKHRGWPNATLYRYHDILTGPINKFDYLFYCDVDMLFVGDVADEILGKLVATLHPGYAEKPRRRFPYETRTQSTAYIPNDQGTHYYAGAFQGGDTESFTQAMCGMREMIDLDSANGIAAKWQDESYWNKCLTLTRPTIVLSPAYCCNPLCQMKHRKILALPKNHDALRM